MFDSVLVANRGEIALRVIRTLRELGIRSIAVHSTEDADSAAVRLADAAVHIGPAPARYSYNNMAAVVEAAVQFGADAIHPGYGFLSEDPDFGDVCAENDIVFIGPPSRVAATLGDKTAARAAMSAAGLPLLPGVVEPLRTVAEASAAAATVGFPLILKAAAGGGGRGMQIVYRAENLAKAYETTRSTAQSLFGDNRVYLERYLTHARHVEVQVLCDKHGNAVHIGERDCTVQRRHQKLIEESPAPGLDRTLLDEMGAAAVRGALAVGYEGAGTFEFLVDDLGNYYFMEMNCRIQVEHPVTEMVSGLDLVAEQIRIAAGEPLRFSQADITLVGHSIECRINAEDPERDFMPTPGRLDVFFPPGGPFVRTDTHCTPGMRVSPTYDSLLAKVIVWGECRTTALNRMQRALAELQIEGHGVRTTAGYLSRLIDHPEFRGAGHSTSLVERAAAEEAEAGPVNRQA